MEPSDAISEATAMLALPSHLLEHCLLFLDTQSLLRWRSVSRQTRKMFATTGHSKRHVQQLLLELHATKAHLKAFSDAASGKKETRLRLPSDTAVAVAEPVTCIGHKGAAGHVLGNTMESFHKAVQLGVDVIEFDVVMCSDGLLCHHDPVFEETGEWLASITMQQACKRLGSVHPSLDQMLRDPVLLKSGVQLYFDLKHTNIVRPTMRAIEKAVVKYGWVASRIIVASFTLMDLLEVNAFRNAITELKGLKTAAIIDGIPLALARDFEALECYAVSVGKTCAQPDFIADCKRRQIKLWAWTVNSRVMVNELIRLGVDGICTDYPELVTAAKLRQLKAATSTPTSPIPVSRKAEVALGSVYSHLGGARQKAIQAIDEARLFTHVVEKCGEVARILAEAAPSETAQLESVLASAEGVAEEILHPLVLSPLARMWAEEISKSVPGRELLAGVAVELAEPLRCQSPMLSFERGFLVQACGMATCSNVADVGIACPIPAAIMMGS